jgi:hypothetical protein
MKYNLLFFLSFFIISNIYAQAFILDTTFKVQNNYFPNYGVNNVEGLIKEPNGKLMIYGQFHNGLFNPSDAIRIYEDGSLDNTWLFPVGFTGKGINTFVKLGNDYYGWNGLIVLKFNNIGLTDTSWSNKVIRAVFCYTFYDPYILPSGTMLMGTDSMCNGVSDKKRWFMRFFPDGSPDTNFKHAPNGVIFSINKYSSDKLLLSGVSGTSQFTRYDTTQITLLCRIDTAGNLDTSFKSIFVWGTPLPKYIQSDGKIIVGGLFKIINYPDYLSLIRLNPDGSLDSSFNNFNSVTSALSCLNTVCPSSDGGYLIGGDFRQYQGYLRNNIAKIDINGFLDTAYFKGQGIDSAFHSSIGLRPYVASIEAGNNDTYYVMGYFTYYDGKKVQPIIRIKGLSNGINENIKEKGELQIYPNPSTTQATITFTQLTKESRLQIYNMLGQMVYEEKLPKGSSQIIINTTSFKPGLYKVVVGESSASLMVNGY